MTEMVQQPRTIQEEVESLLNEFQRASSDSQSAEIATLLVTSIKAEANKQDYGQVRTAIDTQLQRLDNLRSALEAKLGELERLEKERTRREKYTPNWWDRVRADLNVDQKENPSLAFYNWAALYSQALLDWRLDACQTLVNENLSFPSTLSPYVLLFRYGTESLQKGEYPQAIELLDFLTGSDLIVSNQALSPEIRALLYVFCSRIYLFVKNDFEKARQQLENATSLAASDGRIQAAWGHYYRKLEAPQKPEPAGYFQKAVQQSPGEPDGYVGMGLLSEETGSWEVAADWYNRAIGSVTDEPDMQGYLEKLLQPAPGNLFLALARHKLRNNQYALALKAINKALEIGLNDSTEYPNRIAHALKGNILEAEYEQADLSAAQELVHQASEAYSTAGRNYYYLNDFQSSADLFRNAIRLNPQTVRNYWYLADILRLLSASDKKPFVLRDRINEALAVWEQGEKIGIPANADDSWAFHARATIASNLSLLPKEDPEERIWEAICYMERGIIYSSSGARRWSELSRYYRSLDLFDSARDAAQRAMEKEEENLSIIENSMFTLALTGEIDQAEPLLNKLLEKGPKELIDFYKSWQAILYYYQGHYQEALKCIQANVKRYPDDLWGRQFRGDIYRELGNYRMAKRDDEWVWSQRDDPNLAADYITFAWAAYSLEKWDEAVGLALKERKNHPRKESSYFITGLIALTCGELAKAKKDLDTTVRLSSHKRLISDIRHEVLAVEARAAKRDDPNLTTIREFLHSKGGFITKLAAKEAALAKRDTSPLAELKKILKSERKCKVGSWCWVALQAGIGRLYTEQELWREALDTYRQLQEPTAKIPNYIDRFPEASLGIEKAVNAIIKKGDTLLQEEKYQLAQDQFQHLLAFNNQAKEAEVIHARLALTSLLLGDELAALKSFKESIDLMAKSKSGPTGREIGGIWTSLKPTPSIYWKVWDWLRSLQSDENYEEEFPQILQDAREVIYEGLDEAYRLNGTQTELNLPITTPIILEIGDAIVPVVDSKQDGGKFLYEEIPALRDRIEKDMGVRVPGVRARGSGINDERFVIQLEEVPVISGTIPMGRIFCPSPAAKLEMLDISANTIIPGIEPWTGLEGSWVLPQDADKIRNSGLDLWTEPKYLIYQLEAVLRRNLVNFTGYFEVEAKITDFSKTPEGASQISAVLPDFESKLSIARLLRTLLRENIPIVDLASILNSIRSLRLEPGNLDEAVRRARLELRNALPGNRAGTICYPLPDEWEAQIAGWIHVEDNQSRFSPPIEDAHRFISDLKNSIPFPYVKTALIVKKSETRPYIHRLIETRFPGLNVMSAEELI